MALTWFVACEAESFYIENSSISAEQQFRYEPGPGFESFHLHTIHLLRQVGDVLIERRVISLV